MRRLRMSTRYQAKQAPAPDPSTGRTGWDIIDMNTGRVVDNLASPRAARLTCEAMNMTATSAALNSTTPR